MRLDLAALVPAAPRPRVAKPERRQQVQLGRVGPAVGRRNADQDVVGIGLGVLYSDVEIPALVEDVGVGDLEFGIAPRAAAVFRDEQIVGVLGLRIFVERLQVRVRGGRIEIEINLLHVLRVVPLVAVEAEQPLLEDRVLAVPHREGKAQPALAIADAQEAVLAPAIGAAAGVIVREIIPALAGGRVILADRPPLPLGKIRTPPLPIGLAAMGLLQALLFGRHESQYRVRRAGLAARMEARGAEAGMTKHE